MAKTKAKFYEKPISKSSPFYKKCVDFIKANNIRFRMRWNAAHHMTSEAESDTSRIFISISHKCADDECPYMKHLSIQEFVSTVLHECCHVLNYRDSKYKKYHSCSKWGNPDYMKVWVKTGVKAEKYTDKRAKGLMKKLFPDIPFVGGYDEEGIRLYKKHFISYIKDQLENLDA